MIKAIIFDFDGTLTPLTLDFAHLRAEIVNIAGKYVTGETIEALKDHYIIEMIYEIEERLAKETAAGNHGETSAGAFQREAFEKLTSLEVEAAIGKDVYPYTRAVLENLKARGIKTGIITRTSIDVLKRVFVDIENYIDKAVTRESTKYVKPHPFHAIKALHMLGIAPHESMMVGDHPTDVIAGNGAGMITAGVLTGRTGKEDFERAGADYILDDIRGILQLHL